MNISDINLNLAGEQPEDVDEVADDRSHDSGASQADDDSQRSLSTMDSREETPIHSNNPAQYSWGTTPMDTGASSNNAQREVYTIGQNSYGELGHGDTAERHLPSLVQFSLGKDIVQVAAGNEFTAMLTAAGEVFCCGYNDSGQCGLGGTQRVPNLTKAEGIDHKKVTFIHTANGSEHLLLVTDDGELYSCGYNSKGQLGHGAAGAAYAPRLVEALYGHRVARVACSYYHSVVATDLDQLFAFGRNDFGQLGLGDRDDRAAPTEVEALGGGGRAFSALACGQYHTVVALEGGGAFGFGKNDYGQIGMEGHDARLRPAMLSSPLNSALIIHLAAGYYHTAALVASEHGTGGRVYTFGRNDYGQLGHGHRENAHRPALVQGIADQAVVQVACGCYHTVTLTAEGRVFPFGRNNHGQLGTGSTADAPRPAYVEALGGGGGGGGAAAGEAKPVAMVAAGFYHTVLLAGPPLDADRGGRRAPAATLASDLRRMLNNPARSDVTFLLQGRAVHAHRVIIMARCEPLALMLDGPMREAQQDQIVIPDHRYEVFLAFLEWVYTDDVRGLLGEGPLGGGGGGQKQGQGAGGEAGRGGALDVPFALDLLTLADQFLVELLKRKCEQAIQKSITVHNVSEMLVTADARRAASLRKRCFDFILLNFGQVIATKEFSELPPQFLREICQEASQRGVKIMGSASAAAAAMMGTGTPNRDGRLL